MPSIRSRSSVPVSLFLSYLLIILLCTPFTIAARSTSIRTSTRPVQEQPAAPFRPGEVLVRFRNGVSRKDRETIMATHGLRAKKQLRGDSGFETVEFNNGRDTRTVALQLLQNSQVEFAEPNFLISKEDLTPNDPEFNQQWALRNSGQNGGQYGSDINASAAWETTTGSPATVIAVIDSGIDFTHPDLKNNQWTNLNPSPNGDLHGWDYVADSATIKDEQGHGTAIAGIIAAEGNNSVGMSGVMWRASLMSLRVLDSTGTGDVANAVEAIDYAVTHGAQVINLSWGTTGESVALKDALQRALNRNVVVVSSAGNGGKDLSLSRYYPASFDLKGMIAVAATNNFDQLASWSNWGAGSITIAAPGTDIFTTQMGGGYRNVTGTSAAAPVVSGVVGLLKTIHRSANTELISRAIAEGARPSASLAGKVSSGGVVNAGDALAKLHGSANQAPVLHPGYGPGGNGNGFSTTPPALITRAPEGLPNLDHSRTAAPQQTQAKAPIESNLMCADCDPLGGGGGGGNYPSGDPNFSTARGRPINETGQPGVDLGSTNFNWSLPILSLPGRAGLDVNLTLYYNSLVWTKDGSYMKFNADLGSPGPGFRLSLPTLQQRFLNSQTGVYAYLMVMPNGSRVEMRQVGTSNIYESQDSSYTYLDVSNASAPFVLTTDGTRLTFTPVTVNNEFRCTQIKDRNGNYISATYDTTNGHLLTLTDTLGRVITFVYDASNNLQAVRQMWAGATHDWATFYYDQVYVAPAFGGGLLVNGPNNNYTTVLSQVNLHDGTWFTFQYNTAFAQVNRINRYAPNATRIVNYTSYNMNSSSGQTECPRFTERRDWAENWNNGSEAVTSYSVAADNSWSQETTPDGIIHKEFFATSGWGTGLTTATETWSSGVKKKWTTTFWTQDDTTLSYQKNPRVTETNVYDAEGNRRRVVMTYYPTTSFSLPMATYEYAADGVTLLRRTHTNYNLLSAYTSRRIIGLPSGKYVFDGNDNLYQFDVFDYDYGGGAFSDTPQPAVQHDPAYGISFLAGRGNLSLVRRANVNNTSQYQDTVLSYNTTGSVTAVTDPLWRVTSISYTDSFSDAVNRNTFAYPTTVTNPDNFSSTAQYNYDFGAVTRRQDPKGAVQTTTYDGAARTDQITNQTSGSGAYVRYVYESGGSAGGAIKTFSTIQNGAGEAYEVDYFDGAGRVRASGGDNPGSSSGWLAHFTFYDVMGRESQRTNPAEINGSWVPTGDDAAGWASTLQTYDWNGRPLRTTNPDGTYRENTYGGCGCAGGDQVTMVDERGRRKRYTNDVLGRQVKVEELNWDQTVYSTTNYTFNVRDQITLIDQQGQTRTFGYDGYGRLNSRTTPEQGNTTYTYFADDTMETITDARGATTTFGYNNRKLVTSISFGVPSGVAATPNISFGYDSAGNRTSMTDGLGSVSYVYNTLSQLTSETRAFTGVGSYTLSYAYNLAGQLTSITNPWGAQVGYGYDKIGRPTNVSGSGYAGLSSYVNSLSYRAFGSPKQVAYNNGRTLSVQYDNRMRPTQWNIPGVMGWNYAYQYFGENTGRVTYAQNLNDATLDRSFNYDHVGRLQSSFSGSAARAHVGIGSSWLSDGPYAMHDNQYDVWGNLTSRTGWGGTNPQYGAAFTNNKMNAFVYDASGNLADAGGGWTFSYDATGQQASSAIGNVQMFYDGNRLRGKKTENGVATYYLRSTALDNQVVAELASNGDWARGYVYLGGELLAVQQGSVYWTHKDPVVKSTRVTDGSGNVVSTIELDPWGGETNRSSNEAFQPRKFTTYTRDSIASDDAMHRRYNRWWGRFEQPDPSNGSYDVNNPQSLNRYSYVNNDPVNFTDPTGLFCVNYERWDERSATLYVWSECYLENGGGGGGHLVPRDPFGGGGGGIGGGGGGGGLGPRPTPTPQTPSTQQPRVSQQEQNRKDCFEREKVKIDAAREQFRNNMGKRLLVQAALGAGRGAIMGGIAGGIGGGALFGVGAVPGAILGAVVGGITGAAGGVITGGFFWEPVRRELYNQFDYKGALQQAKKFCDAQY